jgi:hypothetical protein
MLARFCWENLKERDYLKDVRVDGRIFNTIGWRGLDSFVSMWGQLAACCEQGNETAGHINYMWGNSVSS